MPAPRPTYLPTPSARPPAARPTYLSRPTDLLLTVVDLPTYTYVTDTKFVTDKYEPKSGEVGTGEAGGRAVEGLSEADFV